MFSFQKGEIEKKGNRFHTSSKSTGQTAKFYVLRIIILPFMCCLLDILSWGMDFQGHTYNYSPMALPASCHVAGLTGWGLMPAALPGWYCTMVSQLFWSLGSSLTSTAALSIAPVGTLQWPYHHGSAEHCS